MSEPGALGDSELPGQVGTLLIGELLHVQGHRPRLIAELVILRDVHVAFRVTCVVGHPDCDWGTCDGHLRATVDRQCRVGGGRGREIETETETDTRVRFLEPLLSRLSQGLPRRACTRGG